MQPQPIEEILRGRRKRPQELIEVLQDVQESHGYISQPIMRSVSAALGVPVIEVYRVASFYKAFSLEPRGKHLVTICLGTACHVRRAPLLLEEALSRLGIEAGRTSADRLFTVERVNCLGACALGPVVVLDGVYHHHMTPAKLRKLIQSIRHGAGASKEARHAHDA